MNAAVLVVLALAVFLFGYRVYARWIERRVYETDSDEPTPAHTTPDGIDFVACRKHVLFGHHFCSVAGAAPIVGPAIAVFWGWLPALLWVVFGTVLIGAVHDFGALALSAKRGGRTMGDIAGEILGPRARVWFLMIIILLTWVVIAVFAWIIAALFTAYPASVIPVNFEIVVAVLIGWWITRRGGKLLWPSIAAVTALYVVVFWSAGNPHFGVLPEALHLYGGPVVTWILFLLVYAFIASVLPVWLLLQPRDYINSHQLFVGLGALLLGILWLHPEMAAPAVNTAAEVSEAPSIFPFLFITIACGAISGFHGLVASGTTSKQLDCLRDARTVGYGAMLGEGTLAVVAVIASAAGIAAVGDWSEFYGTWALARDHGIKNFVKGAGTFLTPVLDRDIAETVVAVIVISFAATTLDTAARIQRFCLGELSPVLRAPALKNRYVGSLVAVLPAAALAIFTEGDKGPGSGGFVLWPVFGTTNQLIGGITLLLLFMYLRSNRRPVLPIVLPLVFLVVMTTYAGVVELRNQIEAGNWEVVVFGALFLLLEVLVFLEAAVVWREGRRAPA
ncbi:MAG: carbon starvation CstA family protein [Planctomycetota bacterium]|jgi:carbon starvation protein